MYIIKLLFVFIMSNARWPATTTAVTILGSVYCYVCHTHPSKHSHFLQGVDVNIECKFKTSSSRKHVVSVNKTTDVHGIYKVDIRRPVEGIHWHCSDDYPTIQSLCRARILIGRQTTNWDSSDVGSKNHTSNHMITLKSKLLQNNVNVCIYILEALSYKPVLTRINNNIINASSSCRFIGLGLDYYYSFNSSKFFFPAPPFVITWPPCPYELPLPFPIISFPNWPYPPYQWIPNPVPSLPFPFPPLPSPPPGGDPRTTWIPINFPFSPPQLIPPWDPRTWIPHPPPTTQIYNP